MKNLFVLHTQYNLLLSVGLCSTDFKEDRNDLVLFLDFKLDERHVKCINCTFSSSITLPGNYPKVELSPIQKWQKIKRDNESIKKYIQNQYDRLFIVDDMCIQEMYAMKCAGELNKDIKMIWLEDGTNAYFSNDVVSRGMGSTPIKRLIRKSVFCTIFNLGRYYDLGPVMGSHYLLTEVYLTFPEAVRIELSGKEVLKISDQAFQKGMCKLFGGEKVQLKNNSIIIAMDMLCVYGDKMNTVCKKVSEIIDHAVHSGKEVYYKLHPRETDKMEELSQCIELDRTVALESYLTNASTRNITVVGFKSTALQTAKKMGYETISYIKQVEPHNITVRSFYESIGIICQ